MTIEWFNILKGAVIPLSIGATLILLFAISHVTATSIGRKPEFRMACRVVRAIAVFLLLVVFWLDGTLALRSSVVGFAGSTAPGNITTSYMTVSNHIMVYTFAFFVGIVLLSISIQSRGVDADYDRLQEMDRQKQMDIERRRDA